MIDEVKVEDKKVLNRNIIFNLFNENQLQRHTYLENAEIPIFNVLLTLGQENDIYQKKYMDKLKTFKCNLTKLSETALRLRTSRKGWRSEQVVKVAHSDFNKEKIEDESKFVKIKKLFQK